MRKQYYGQKILEAYSESLFNFPGVFNIKEMKANATQSWGPLCFINIKTTLNFLNCVNKWIHEVTYLLYLRQTIEYIYYIQILGNFTLNTANYRTVCIGKFTYM